MILMYHHVSPPDAIPTHGPKLAGWEFNISPNAFSHQLQSLRLRGFRFVALSEYVRSLELPCASRSRQVAITFDDGWMDNYAFAFPILSSLGITATFFIVTGDMQDISAANRMELSHLRDLVRGGMEMGGHSVSHPNLTTLSEERLRAELAGCKDHLEQQLGTEVRHFAYPGGRFNRRVVEQCEKLGYQSAACSIGWGQNSPATRFHLFRETLDSSSTPLRNALKQNLIVRRMLSGRAWKRVKKMLE